MKLNPGDLVVINKDKLDSFSTAWVNEYAYSNLPMVVIQTVNEQHIECLAKERLVFLKKDILTKVNYEENHVNITEEKDKHGQ